MSQSTRVVIIGHSPLPHENVKKNFAPGARTWDFAKAAADVGCKVLILGSRITNSYKKNTPFELFEKIGNIDYYSLEKHLFENIKWMKNKITEFNPDCIVGINTYPASVVTKFNFDIPFWADFNGSIMSEAQTKAAVYDDNTFLNHYLKMESPVLSKADVFSSVSESQGFSLVGELGIWGRLNKENMGYRLVRVIPIKGTKKFFQPTKNIIRGKLANDDDFVILYSGGYNTWTDVKTLFYGLEDAMSKNSKIVFVSTGGQIDGHDEYTYNFFKKLIDKSPFKEKFHLQGWVPHDDLPNYYLESNLGINVDKYSYEAILGSRNRVLDWMQASLPFITTPLSEITKFLVDRGVAYQFEYENSSDLSEQILHITSNLVDLQHKQKLLLEIYNQELISDKIFDDFKAWVINPKFSPDHNMNTDLIKFDDLNISVSSTQISTLQQTAINLWPRISKILKFFKMQKYENKIKKIGENLVTTPPEKKYKAKIFDLKMINMITNEKYSFPLKVKNIGSTTWYPAEFSEKGINLSYHWKDHNNKIIIHDGIRTGIKNSIKPNQTVKLNLKILTPSQPGNYILEVDMLKEHTFWFSELDSKPLSLKLNVKKKLQNDINNYPLISVIVVTYNSEDYINACLESILKSDYPQMEVIVIDNASTDNTLQKLKQFKNRIITIPNSENLGFAGGNNLGIKQSKGEIIVLINPDVYVTKTALMELVNPLLFYKEIMITGSKILFPNTNIIQSAGGIIQSNGLTNHFGYKEEDKNQYDFLSIVDYVTGASMAIQRTLFEQTGLLDTVYKPAYYEETEKCVQANKLNFKVVFTPKSIVYHHESTSLGVLSTKFLKTFHSSRFKFVYRNYSISSFLTKFVPSELKWFLFNCNKQEKYIVINAHLKTIFSPHIKIKKPITF